MAKILAFGASAVDIIAYVPRFAQEDELIFPDRMERLPGGSGANVAAAIACLEHEVTFVGTTGDDDAGQMIRTSFASVGVHCQYLFPVPHAFSGGAFIAVNPQGERLMYSLGGESVITSLDQVRDIDWESYDALYMGEVMPDVGAYASKKMKGLGKPVFFTPGGMYCYSGLSSMSDILPYVSTLFLSSTEAAALQGGQEELSFVSSLLPMIPSVVITRGMHGSDCYSSSGTVHCPSYPVPAVDTTGAGDAFAAAYIAAQMDGLSAEESLRQASACAAISVQKEGARASVTKSQITSFLQTR